MTRKTRQVLLALTVTTALCADQVAVAAPTLRPQVAELAGRIVNRLSHSFRQVVRADLPVHARQRGLRPQAPALAVVAAAESVPHPTLSAFQFRLPPPTL